MAAPSKNKLIASNRKARHDFEILDVVEAGIVLKGAEVKSMREAQVQLADAYAQVERGEMWLHGMHITAWPFATGVGYVDPDRRRKLLLRRDEIDRLAARVAQERLTLVPLSVYFKEGRAKVEIALARGRKTVDRRHAIAERDAAAEVRRSLGRAAKGMTD